ncbi:MAG: glycosyltransferase family 39 protein [Gammaproteobacteria bacterium]
MRTFRPYFLLTLLCAALYLPGITTIPVTDRDEAHFAQATRQMLTSNNFFQIRFQDTTRYQKPPGINWLQALSVTTFSDAESNKIWPYRIPSVLGGLFAVLLTFAFCRHICNEKVALLAAGLLAITLLLVVEARIALTDAMLLASMVLMQASLGLIYLRYKWFQPIRWPIPLFFWLALSFGFLLKGVTPLVAILTIVTLCVVDRNIKWLKQLRFHWGIPLFILLSSWLFFVSRAEESNYLAKMLEKDLLPKLAGGHESHGGYFGFHLLLLMVTFWPASLFLWHGGIWAWRHRRHAIEKFLLAWILPTWIFFELMPTKLPQYMLPTFPAIALLVALAITYAHRDTVLNKYQTLLKVLCSIWVFISIIATSAIIGLSYLFNGNFAYLNIIVTIALWIMICIALIFVYQQKLRHAAYTLIISTALIYPVITHYIPVATDLWSSEKIVREIQSHSADKVSEQAPLLAIDYREPSLVFLLGTKHVKFVDIGQIVSEISTTPRIILISASDFAEVQQLIQQQNFRMSTLETIQGFNYSKGRMLDLKLIEVNE